MKVGKQWNLMNDHKDQYRSQEKTDKSDTHVDPNASVWEIKEEIWEKKDEAWGGKWCTTTTFYDQCRACECFVLAKSNKRWCMNWWIGSGHLQQDWCFTSTDLIFKVSIHLWSSKWLPTKILTSNGDVITVTKHEWERGFMNQHYGTW